QVRAGAGRGGQANGGPPIRLSAAGRRTTLPAKLGAGRLGHRRVAARLRRRALHVGVEEPGSGFVGGTEGAEGEPGADGEHAEPAERAGGATDGGVLGQQVPLAEKDVPVVVAV